jgi:hypothetical protein
MLLPTVKVPATVLVPETETEDGALRVSLSVAELLPGFARSATELPNLQSSYPGPYSLE